MDRRTDIDTQVGRYTDRKTEKEFVEKVKTLCAQ
jgi:hypothetical protein